MTKERIQEILKRHVLEPKEKHNQSVGAVKQAKQQIGANTASTNLCEHCTLQIQGQSRENYGSYTLGGITLQFDR